MFGNDGFGWFAFALLDLSAMSCGGLLLRGWLRFRLLARQDGEQLIVDVPSRFTLGSSPFPGGALDVAAEAQEVLHEMAAAAAGRLVQLEFAAQMDLSVQVGRPVFRSMLRQLVGNAMRLPSVGRVLLSALRLGESVQISVIDDGEGRLATVQEAALRDLAQVVALHGGTIEIESRRGTGTAVVLRLPQPVAPGRPKRLPTEPADPSKRAATGEMLVEDTWDI